MQQDFQLSMRFPKDLVDRADALVSAVGARPEYEAVRVSRSMVLRLAVFRGVAALEAEAGLSSTASPAPELEAEEPAPKSRAPRKRTSSTGAEQPKRGSRAKR